MMRSFWVGVIGGAALLGVALCAENGWPQEPATNAPGYYQNWSGAASNLGGDRLGYAVPNGSGGFNIFASPGATRVVLSPNVDFCATERRAYIAAARGLGLDPSDPDNLAVLLPECR